MTLLRTNKEITKVERVGKLDQYGQESRNVVFTHLRCWLELEHRLTRNLDGDFGRVDGLIIVDAASELMIGDNLWIDNEEYEVVSVTAGLDAAKKPRTGEYDIVKQNR